MLLSDKTLGKNEIEWFFQNEANKENNDKFETRFLGWKMGSAVGTSTKSKIKNKTSERVIDPTEDIFPDQPVKTAPTWKTLILADSTIHYIPLEEMATVKPCNNAFIPDDALDPFYLDMGSQADIFNNQYFYKVSTTVPQHKLVPRPNLFSKTNSKMIFCPIGLSLQKKIMPFLETYRGVAPHPSVYNRKSKVTDLTRLIYKNIKI